MNDEIQELLAELRDEREKYTRSNRERMKEICDRLVELGYYPALSGIAYEPLRMVEAWGVDWNVYRGPQECRHCGADLCDRKNGPPFKREIGQYDRDRDRTVAFMCPECQKLIWQEPEE